MSTIDPPFIGYGRQWISEADIVAVEAVLRSDYLTQGPAIERFEGRLKRLTGADYACAMANATAALHLSCLAVGVGPGDRVWTSPNSFVASANCALYCGATIDFVDIEPGTWNMSAAKLAEKLQHAEQNNVLPKAIIPVHFAGQSCDMAAIRRLTQPYGIRVIEDASHAVGGRHGGAMTGACEFSDIAVFSFHPVKIVTTGEGGAALTRDPVLAAALETLRTHGITRDPDQMERAAPDPWYYEQHRLGFNYRITDIQAALGSSQLTRIQDFLARRHAIADQYDQRLAALPLQLPVRKSDGYSALHLYPVALNDAAQRKDVFHALRAANIGVNVHYIPIHLQPYYRRRGFAEGDFPVAEDYYQRAISLPMHPQLTQDDIDRVVTVLTQALR